MELGVLNEHIGDFVADFAKRNRRPNVVHGFADVREILPDNHPPITYVNAIAVAIALDPAAVATIENGPTIEYYEEQQACEKFGNDLENALIEELGRTGHKAISLSELRDTKMPGNADSPSHRVLSHRLVATYAGLGWIGKSGLIITKHFGPAVVLAIVMTDAPLDCSREVFLSRCNRCMECVLACPNGAINTAEWQSDMSRADLVDSQRCADACHRQSMELLGREEHVCGVCIRACPYTQSYLLRNGLPIA